jgi:hypothetical protein
MRMCKLSYDSASWVGRSDCIGLRALPPIPRVETSNGSKLSLLPTVHRPGEQMHQLNRRRPVWALQDSNL